MEFVCVDKIGQVSSGESKCLAERHSLRNNRNLVLKWKVRDGSVKGKKAHPQNQLIMSPLLSQWSWFRFNWWINSNCVCLNLNKRLPFSQAILHSLIIIFLWSELCLPHGHNFFESCSAELLSDHTSHRLGHLDCAATAQSVLVS